MQVASRQETWTDAQEGVLVEFEVTELTGLLVPLGIRLDRAPARIDWGDGTAQPVAYKEGVEDYFVAHAYPRCGRYSAVIRGAVGLGARPDEWMGPDECLAALVSVRDRTGRLTRVMDNAFMIAAGLRSFVAPAANWVGESAFCGCSSLERVELGPVAVQYDSAFRDCRSLVDWRAASSGVCWQRTWSGCAKVRTLRLGAVSQLSTDCFAGCARLRDVWIDGRTAAQIAQVAPSGNIVGGFGSRFPWGARDDCRFHGTDGVVLGDGTVVG